MSLKRRNTSSPECESTTKRQRSQPVKQVTSYDDVQNDEDDDEEEIVDVNERPQINAYTGQSGAFPGLSSNDGDAIFYGPANDGIDYLRMVRSEAKGIPHLLRAQTERNHDELDPYVEDDEEDEWGYWDDDGTYTARPGRDEISTTSNLAAAQLYCYDSLLAQFHVLRATMKCVPPLSAIETLTSSQPISFPPESRKARSTWRHCLVHREPSPTQMACVDGNSIFELLRLVTAQMRGLFQTDDVGVAKRLGAWIWAILGKCPDRGELGSEEVSDLRELAQKAVDVRQWLDKKTGSFVPTEEEDDGSAEAEKPEENLDLGSGIEAARRRLENKEVDGGQRVSESGCQDQTSLSNVQAAKQEKMVVLDMILTVVGEVYGQRDLLELRKPWNVMNKGLA
ncbi:hypothetical protein H2198_000421 [Neophaeococcomyces mojaviensis]|uniref:Uncharacterized protein n=1 Tax=Neophaeococcomyces mojaviensis TaxID=3383035 RepID=A0ACC3AK10_9EURO|nr:hypothetical protein H2198_000421 [Knufia sp. JES_112]